MQQRYLPWVIQGLFWTILLALPYFMVPGSMTDEGHKAVINMTAEDFDSLPAKMVLATMPFNISLIVFFYLHHYILFDRLVLKRRFSIYALVITGLFGVILLITFYFKRGIYDTMPFFLSDLSVRNFIRYLTWFLVVMLSSLGMKLYMQWVEAEGRTKAVETEHLRTELSMLHAQINPHFLFNSLNSIYSLALKKSSAAPDAVLKLSQLLRYVIEDASQVKVSLENEIAYLNNYIDMQKLRNSPGNTVNFQITGDASNVSIAPLVFLPFVENAFKYGINGDEPSNIDIALHINRSAVGFEVRNKKLNVNGKPSTGIGIQNVQRRLELLYPGKHQLNIESRNGSYYVNLKIETV